jgi:predicted NBD/HSP70 family sugar kinase
VETDGPVCSCGNVGCLEALFGGVALARDALLAASSGQSPLLAERLAAVGALTARGVACINLIRAGGRRAGQVLAGPVSFMSPTVIVIGGGLAGLGRILLAEIRSVVYQRSRPWPPATCPS